MPFKVTINDSFSVIVICRHSTTTIISNIVIFNFVVIVVICFRKDELEKGKRRTVFRQFLLWSEIP